MVNNKDYYKLDEIGFIGIQEKKNLASKKYHDNKTAQIFEAAKVAKHAQLKKDSKKI